MEEEDAPELDAIEPEVEDDADELDEPFIPPVPGEPPAPSPPEPPAPSSNPVPDAFAQAPTAQSPNERAKKPRMFLLTKNLRRRNLRRFFPQGEALLPRADSPT